MCIPASSKGGGQTMGFPDVCKVPAPPAPFAPTPFMNISQVATSTGTSKKVKFSNMPAATKKTKQSMSNGDEAGVLGGLKSNVNMNQVDYNKVTSKVKVEGQGTAHHGSMTGHNGSNENMPAGTQAVPSQTNVLVAPS